MATPSTLDVLLEITDLLQRDLTGTLEAHGLTSARTHLLWVLQHEAPMTQQRLAGALRVSPRNVTGLVDGLVGTGHVTREAHPDDRRATLVTLTERGTSVMTEMVAGHERLSSQLFDGLPVSFGRHLAQVRNRLAALVETP